MTTCECGGNSCCCASITGLRGGIHPDLIRSTYYDVHLPNGAVSQSYQRTNVTKVLLDEPAHIVSVDIGLVSLKRSAAEDDKTLLEPTSAEMVVRESVPVSVSLFTMRDYTGIATLTGGGFDMPAASDQSRHYFCTATLTAQSPSWSSHPDLFGYFADGGMFVELNTPSDQYGVRVVVNYVERLQFAPAYHDPVQSLLHYWRCARGQETEFLEGFYAGTRLNINDSEQSTLAASSVGGSGSDLTATTASTASLEDVRGSDPFASIPLSTWGTDLWY